MGGSGCFLKRPKLKRALPNTHRARALPFGFFYGGFCSLGESVVLWSNNLREFVHILTTTGSEMTLEHPSDDELTITGAIYSE